MEIRRNGHPKGNSLEVLILPLENLQKDVRRLVIKVSDPLELISVIRTHKFHIFCIVRVRGLGLMLG